MVEKAASQKILLGYLQQFSFYQLSGRTRGFAPTSDGRFRAFVGVNLVFTLAWNAKIRIAVTGWQMV